MKNVLHIQKVKYIAGSENHLLSLLPRLSKYSYKPTMLVLADPEDQPGDFCDRMRAHGVLTEVMMMRWNIDPMLLRKLKHFIHQGNFDLVHTHLFHADLYGGLAAHLAGIPTVISTKHNDDAFRRLYPIRLLNKLNSHLFNRFICISHHIRYFSSTIEKLPVSRMDVIHYGIDIELQAQNRESAYPDSFPAEKRPLLGIVARLTQQKGHIPLLHAMKKVASLHPDVHLAIVGDGELRDQLEKLTEEIGIQRNVTFLGYYPGAKELMKEFDIFVHPSRWEGFGLVFLEAMAAARPVIATNVSAIPEIVIDHETGLLVPPDDFERLAQAICSLLDDPEWARELGENGRRRVEQSFTIEQMVQKTIEVYNILTTH